MIRAVPAALRDHRRRFRKPARYVVDLGGGEYFVFTEDGELLDAMMIEQILAMLPPLKPIAMKERVSLVFIEKGQIDVKDGAFVVIDETGIRTHIPVGSIACIMLEPGTRVSHMAAALAARAGTLLVWVGEAGVRVYASGQPGGARSDRLLYQAKLALDDAARLKVVRKMYEIRFGEKPPERRSVEQLRGIEGARRSRPAPL